MGNLPIQSPLYVPPSMGGAGAASVSPKHVDVVQSPQYVAHSGTVAADVVQSPAYNPASPLYGQQPQVPLTQKRRGKKLPPASIKEEANDHSD